MVPDVLEVIKMLTMTDMVAMVEMGVILVGVTLSILVLRARVGMKRVQAARMLSLWIGSLTVRLRQIENIDPTDIILPTYLYEGLVSSGLIAQFDEEARIEVDYLYQLVYGHNKMARKERFQKMWDSIGKLDDAITKIEEKNRSRLRVIARLFD